MKRLFFLPALAVAIGLSASAQAQDVSSFARGALGSGAGFGQTLGDMAVSRTFGDSPFTQGLGQMVSGWTQQGIQGTDLADRIHWLQGMRADEMAQRTRWLDQGGFSDPDRAALWRDIREDRREIRDDER